MRYRRHIFPSCVILLALAYIYGCGTGISPAGTIDPPSNLDVDGSDTDMIISWDTVAGADAYDIYFSDSPNVTKDTGTKIENASSPYLQAGLAEDTLYYYAVAARGALGESDLSTEAHGHLGFQGRVDTTFNSPNGYTSHSFTSEEPTRNFVEVASDGNIYYANFDGTETGIVIWGIDENGATLTGFGSNGVVTVDETCMDRYGNIVLDRDDNIYVGTTCYTDKDYLAIYKYDGSGTLIDSMLYDNDIPSGESIAIDDSGYIYMTGTSHASEYATVWKFDSDLDIVTSFGTGGAAIYDAGSNWSEVMQIVFDEAGNIYGVGEHRDRDETSPDHPQLFKFDKDGNLDADFGDNGTVIYTEVWLEAGAGMALDPEGYIYIITNLELGGETRGVIDKYDVNGIRVASFAENGRYTLAEHNQIMNGVVEEDGEDLFVSAYYYDGQTFYNYIIAIDRSTGQIDTLMFDDGIYVYDGPVLMLQGMVYDNAGRIMVTGPTIWEVPELEMSVLRIR